MTRGSCLAVASMLSILASQPCMAADDFIADGDVQHRSAAFGGVTFRVPLGGSAVQRPSLRLQATTMNSIRGGGVTLQTDWPAGIEIGFSEPSGPNLYLGGQKISDVDERLSIGGETDTVLIIVGTVALIGLVLIAMKGRAATASY